MFIKKNYNPKGRNINDCLIRALTAFHGGEKTYSMIKTDLIAIGRVLQVGYNTDSVIMHYCKQEGLKMYISNDKRDSYLLRLAKKYRLESVVVPTKNKRINVNNFCKHNDGKVIVCSSTHAIYVENKDYYDTWDSGRRFVTFAIRK